MRRIHAVKGDGPAGDGGRDGEGLGLEAVAHDAMLDAAQPIDALDADAPVRTALDVRAHAAQHRDEVVDLRLQRRVVDGRRPSREGGGEQDVLGAHDRHDREVDMGAAQPVGRGRGVVVAVAVLDRGAQLLERGDVEVDRPAADAVTARVRKDDASEAREHRPEEDEAGAHALRGLERHERPIRVDGGQLERIPVGAPDVEADVGHHLAHERHVADAGHVAQP